LRWIRQ